MSRQREDPSEVRSHGPLFDPPERALSGRTDPQTSREAAERMVDLYILGEHQRLALAAIRYAPGKTAKEIGAVLSGVIGEEAEVWRQRIGRRLNEIEKAGLIRREGERDGCCCWWPVDKEPR